MTPPQRDQRVNHLGIGGLRAVMRPARAIPQAKYTLSLVLLEPLVPGLAADAVLARELGHRKQPRRVLTNEFQALLHGRRLAPRHRGTSGVVAAPAYGEKCYPCRWTEVLPMSLD